ncbi:hypothetical protein CRI94_10640 [Longibacter salinarum]|uniref:Uncharacterized protein n=1 Tax=Longibacter salinarum TaxID=1850348 RepID=A0A2A8CWM7_9BACT|nr:hypothetical protein [Longibacter salinarum]PEN13102.1 hypothetical protein CRI94_10640 [Longibacter salinarum]
MLKGKGTISFVDQKGGFFAIHADSGAQYNPGGLHEKFHKEGLRVRFAVTPKEGSMVEEQWGTPVEVHEIEMLDEESTPDMRQ